MDWSKAKKILIIAFLIMNIILLSTFLYRTKEMKQYITTEKDVIESLNKVDIKINTKIPKDIPDMELLEVEYEEYGTDSKRIGVAQRFLEMGSVINLSKDVKVDEEEEVITFTKGNKTLNIFRDKELVYINKDRNKLSDIEYDPYKVVENFLEDKGFSTDDYKLNKMIQNDNSYYIEYSNKYEDTIIEKSYMRFTIESSNIIKFERLWLEPIGQKENNIQLKPATDSLLKLLSEEDVYGKNIDDMRLCYYFDPTDTELFGFGDPRSGDAIPAWKVEFNDGTIKYLYDN